MEVRQYVSSDNDMLLGWFKSHGWPLEDMSMVPPFGLVVEIDGVPTAAAWLYISTCNNLAFLEWTVSNPDANNRDVYRAIMFLLEVMKKTACANGISALFSSLNNRVLIKMFAKAGFAETDTGMTNMVLKTGN